MRHLNESILSKKTGIYRLKPDKESVIKWLDENGFVGFDKDRKVEAHLKHNGNSYMVGPNYRNVPKSNWVAVHTTKIYEIVFWFTNDGREIEEIELRRKDSVVGKELSFDDAKQLLMMST